jgi:hypothetical protein
MESMVGPLDLSAKHEDLCISEFCEHTPVILFADPPLQAEMRIRSSIMLSLILLLPD